jgi:hypothetical protein
VLMRPRHFPCIVPCNPQDSFKVGIVNATLLMRNLRFRKENLPKVINLGRQKASLHVPRVPLKAQTAVASLLP